MRHELEVTIDETTGEISLGVHGELGRGCLKVLEEWAKALGKAKTDATPTQEMYERAVTTAKVKR